MTITPFNWVPIRDALEAAYKQLGLEKEKTDGGSKCNETHWDIACLIYEQAKKDFTAGSGGCYTCKQPLDYYSVIRCLDCRSTLCEYCAKQHFGPQHGSRANASHPQ